MPRSGPHSAGSTYSTWVTPPSPHSAPDVITPFIGFSSPLTSEKGKGRLGTRTQRPPPPGLSTPHHLSCLLRPSVFSVLLFLIRVG